MPARMFHRLLAGALLALAATGAAQALEAEDALAVQIRPVLDRLPSELDGLLVALHQTPAPHISVHNLTDRTLTVLDHAERPYLRIGPGETHGDFANAWFHRAWRGDDGEAPSNVGGPARWHKIDTGPAFGWWDPRLRVVGELQPPPGVTGGDAKFLRRWRIPVRFGETRSDISGYFLYHPAPEGVHRVAVDEPDVLGEDVTVHPLLGDDPGVFIANLGNAKFRVPGAEGEPFLRFVPGKVLINANSATWKRAAPEDTQVPYSGPGQPRWVVISTTGGFGWRDPRVDAGDQRPDDREPAPVLEWSIPADVDGDEVEIEGETWWLPPATATVELR